MRVNFTDRFVSSAKPGPKGRIEHFDALKDTRGLSLRVSEHGQKTWTFTFTSKDSKRVRITLGTYPGTSLATARTRTLEAKSQIGDGRDPRDLFAAKDASAITVAMLSASFLEKHVRPNLRSAATYEHRYTKAIGPVIGAVRLADLHRRDINRVLDPIVRRGSPVEAVRVFAHLHAMFMWAVRRGDLDRNPMAGMAKPAETGGPRERFLTDDEIRYVWHALPEALARSLACQRIVKLCLVTGQRVGEIARLHRDELDLKQAVWNLPAVRAKNGNSHVIPLSSLAITMLEEALADAGDNAGFIFPSKVIDTDGKERIKALDPHAVATTLRRAHTPSPTKPNGDFDMPQWTAHDLRRTALTGLAKLGVAPIIIGSVANHLSVTKAGVTFASYVKHSYQEEKRVALDLWASYLESIIAGNAAKVVPIRRVN